VLADAHAVQQRRTPGRCRVEKVRAGAGGSGELSRAVEGDLDGVAGRGTAAGHGIAVVAEGHDGGALDVLGALSAQGQRSRESH